MKKTLVIGLAFVLVLSGLIGYRVSNDRYHYLRSLDADELATMYVEKYLGCYSPEEYSVKGRRKGIGFYNMEIVIIKHDGGLGERHVIETNRDVVINGLI